MSSLDQLSNCCYVAGGALIVGLGMVEDGIDRKTFKGCTSLLALSIIGACLGVIELQSRIDRTDLAEKKRMQAFKRALPVAAGGGAIVVAALTHAIADLSSRLFLVITLKKRH